MTFIIMAYNTAKKKKILTKQDQEWIDKMVNASKKWYKPCRGEIVFVSEGCPQEFVIKAKYSSEDELSKDAEETIAYMNSIDKSKKWKLVSAALVGKAADSIEEQES